LEEEYAEILRGASLLRLLSSAFLNISSHLYQEALMAQSQEHLAALEPLLSMPDRDSGCQGVKGVKGGRGSDCSCWAVGKDTPLAGTEFLDQYRQGER
jgi:hypothetical protein